MAGRRPIFNQGVVIDTTPMPDSVPPVKEIGASSAPLLSASFFIGARCQAYNDDYMKCKDEAAGQGEIDCMREGRKVTRCAASVYAVPQFLILPKPPWLRDINENCLREFRNHWNCLDNHNHELWNCRGVEQSLNKCVFDKLKLEKKIPGSPEGSTPVHMRKKQIWSDRGAQ